jgi:hypothetical protein
MDTYVLGQEIDHKGKKWLIVRSDDVKALFDTPGGVVLHSEHFIQLRSAHGEFDFITLWEYEEEFQQTAGIKALPNQPWRKKDAVQTIRG